MAYVGTPPATFSNNLTNVQLVDDISGSFNGSTQTFALTSSSAPFHAVSARSLIVVLGGIVQKPQVDYTVDGSNITFTTAPTAGITFAARNIYGLNYLNNVNDGVITPAKLSTGAPTWNTGGTVTVTNSVGIGTNSPSQLIHIYQSDGNSQAYQLIENNRSRNAATVYKTTLGSWLVGNGVGADVNRFSIYQGSDRLVIDSSGNIGIGTTNPTTKLELQSSYTASATNHFATFARNGGAINAVIGYNAVDLDYMYVGTGTAHPFGLRSNNTLALYIDTNQKVGIGTASPSGLFHVANTGTTGTTADNLNVFFSSANRNATVNIIATNTEASAINFGDGDSSTVSRILYSHASDYMAFSANTDERIRITSAGNIGIGTTNPTQKLDVVGNFLVTSDGTSTITSSTSGRKIEFQPQNIDSEFRIYTNYVGGKTGRYFLETFDGTTQKNYLDHSGGGYFAGKVFIGSLNEYGPANQLASDKSLIVTSDGENSLKIVDTSAYATGVGASIVLGGNYRSAGDTQAFVRLKSFKENSTDANYAYGFSISTTPNNGSITEKLRITSDGNVGIGTNNPQTKLQVDGVLITRSFENGTGASGIMIGSSIKSGTHTTFGVSIRTIVDDSSNNSYGMQFFTQESYLTGQTEKIRINSIGNVGIGTTNPQTKLHVHGDLMVGGTANTLRRSLFDTNGRLFINYADNNKVANLILRNCGDAATSTGHGSTILWQTSTNVSSSEINSGQISVVKEELWTSTTTTQNSTMTFETSYQGALGEAFRVNSLKNMGIGETNPQSKLVVKRNSNDVFSISNYFNPSTNSGIHVTNESSTAGAFSALTLESRSSASNLQNTSIIVRSSGSSNYVPQGVSFTYSADSTSQKYWMDWTQQYGISHQNFNLSWTYYNGDNVARTFTWLNVFNQIFTGSSGRLIRNGYAYKFYLFGTNGRHIRIYEGVVHIGDIDTYGANSAAIYVSSIAEIPGGFPSGCGNPFSSISTTGFTYRRENCFQSANVSLMALNNRTSIETITGTP